ncbi:hypothetical protein [Actinomyces glycerinitolerans]|uniref:Uncharacterized protein n=1 Tax=Actinomyces glycerinitolerans TaxID=1892869 RepID=A0A1M4RYA5_9ACTO|nr:hypothetical protein [Actinomyces glycerinitolerans]SHE24938.1 Hypothetical protein ACGLYG10_1150 [Actinomyces glycerinitolerans]
MLTVIFTLTIGGTVLAAPARLYAAESVQVAAAPAPAIPESLSDTAAWQLTLDYEDTRVEGVVAGAAGPILVTDHGAMGLDPHTGETTWSYTRPAKTVHFGAGCWEASIWCYGVLSPDRNHLVLGYDAGRLGTPLVVLNTANGEVAFEHYYSDRTWRGKNRGTEFDRREGPSIQVTDNVLWVGQEILSLTDGSLQATLSDDYDARYGSEDCPRDDVQSCRQLFPPEHGGHSTLVLGSTCWNPNYVYEENDQSVWCEVAIAPDDDPTGIITVDAVVPKSAAWPRLVFADGWTVRYADPEAAYATLSEQTSREQTEKLNFPLEAVSIDALSGTESAPSIPLGEFNGPIDDYWMHPRTITLFQAQANPDETGSRSVFDTTSGHIYTYDELAEQTSGYTYLDSLRFSSNGASTNVIRTDDSIALLLRNLDLNRSALPGDDLDTNLLQAPGVIAVVARQYTYTVNGDLDRTTTVIVGFCG